MRVVLVVVALLAGCGRRNFNDGEIDAAVAGDATDATDATDAAGGWALPGWAARQPVTISLPTGSQLDDFPVLVRLVNGMSDFGRMAADGHDLRFVDATGMVLAQDIEKFDTMGAAIWIKVPTIQSNTDVELMMYFNNPSAPNLDAQRDQVWDISFKGVYHLGSAVEDVSREHNAANANNPVAVTGVAGNARRFNETNADRVTIGATGFSFGFQQRTLCAWANPALLDASSRGLVGYGGAAADDGFFLVRNGVDLLVGGNNTFVVIPTAFALRWDYYCMTRDSSGLIRVFVGGAQVHASQQDAWSTMQGIATIGAWNGGYWAGDLDEVRISSLARSPAWIAAEVRVVNTDVARFGQIEPP